MFIVLQSLEQQRVVSGCSSRVPLGGCDDRQPS